MTTKNTPTPEKPHLPSAFERARVSFESGGLSCAGYLYRPRNVSGRVPCVVLANGFSGTMDWLLPAYAVRFAEAGFAVLIFDYRYFGESEGRPRQLLLTRLQREDVQAAVRFARNQAGIDPDRIALWGTSLGGGHVFYVAVEDPRIAAVVTQVPGFDLVSKAAAPLIKVPAALKLKLLVAILRDAVQGLLGLPPFYVKVYGDPGETAVFSDPQLKPRFEALMKGSATWKNAFTPRFYLSAPRYEPGTAEKLRAPLLVCIADGELYGNPQFQVKIGQLAPSGRVRHYSGDHFDFYHDMFDQVVADEIDFLQTHLIVATA